MNIHERGRIFFYENQVEEIQLPRRLLPEIRAELNEILNALNDADINLPIAGVIARWYEEFESFLFSPPERIRLHPMEVIRRFTGLLENILADPLNRDEPYPEELFGNSPSPMIQFIVGRMRDSNSLLYSERLAAIAPELPLPPERYDDFKDLALLQAMAKRIDAFFEGQVLEREAAMPNLQEVRNRVHRVEIEQQKQLNQIENIARERIAEAQAEIQGLREDLRAAAERRDNVIAELQQEAEGLRGEIIELNGQIERLQEEVQAIVRACHELDRSIKQVEADLKENQSNWLSGLGKMAISIAVTWALQQILPGSGALLTKDGFMLGLVKPI